MRFRFLFFLGLCLLPLNGCSLDSDSKEAMKSLISAVDLPVVNFGKGEKAPLAEIKKELTQNKYLFDVVIVQNSKKILVAYKVKHIKRFNLKNIDKKITNNLTKKYPEFDFIVSSDLKIFLEAVELNVHVTKEDYPEQKAKKWFDKIVKLTLIGG